MFVYVLKRLGNSVCSCRPVVKMSTTHDNSSVLKSLFYNVSGAKSLITIGVLSLAWLVGFSSRLFAVIRFESIIHEFDPW